MAVSGLLMDIKRMAIHDGPGIRTTLFLKGCPLKCVWCHNPEGIAVKRQLAYFEHKCIGCGQCVDVCPRNAHSLAQTGHFLDRSACRQCGACVDVCLGDALKLYGQTVTVEDALKLVQEDRIFYGNQGGVTLSGGEPLLQEAFVLEFLKAAKAAGINTAIDTCGFVPWKAYEAVLPYTDIFLYDLKHINAQQHLKFTGQSNERILENLQKLSAAGTRIEIRIPLGPGCNDDQKNLQETAVFLSKLFIEKVRVLPYHALARSKYLALGLDDTMPQVPSPDKERVKEIVELFQNYNLPAFSGYE